MNANSSPLLDVRTVVAELEHTFVLKNDGTVWAWGNNDFGQLGDGTEHNAYHPVQVVTSSGTPLDGVTQISTSLTGFTVVLRSDSSVWGWGSPPSNGNQNELSASPLFDEAGNPIMGFSRLAANGDFVVALKPNGTVWTWGGNYCGLLLEGTYNPFQVLDENGRALTNIIGIASGNRYSLALEADGSVWAWGCNRDGQLGTGDTVDRDYAVQVK